MRESAGFVCDVWCDIFEMFPLRLHFGSIYFNPIFINSTFSIVVPHHTAPTTLGGEQEIVLSAAVGHLVLVLDTDVRISKKTAPFRFR